MVIGLVCPLGTNIQPVMAALDRSLCEVGYTSREIRLSSLLREESTKTLPREGEGHYLQTMMQEGDEFREAIRSGAAIAVLAIVSIWKWRELKKLEQKPEASFVKDAAAEDGAENEIAPPIARHASIVRSLKHPDEANLFRSVYGNRFILIGVSAPEPARRQQVIDQLSEEQSAFRSDEVSTDADRLIRRDARDPDNEYGQNVKRTFELADVFVDASSAAKAEASIKRFIELLFGSPFITPTLGELSMAHAHTASLRSSAAGRQVGAVICNEQGEVLSTGCNQVPKSGGGQYWPGDEPDDRDFHAPIDPNDTFSRRVLAEVLGRLKDAGWLGPTHAERSPQELLTLALTPLSEGGIDNTRIADLIEFGRIMHAEMAAIVGAARKGIAIQDGILYSTTFPCHECAKHIIGVGITQVVFISPYAKSLVREMFGKAVAIDEGQTGGHRVSFESFVGVSPGRFQDLFQGKNRKNKETGTLSRWNPSTAVPRLASESPAGAIVDRESEVLDAFPF